MYSYVFEVKKSFSDPIASLKCLPEEAGAESLYQELDNSCESIVLSLLLDTQKGILRLKELMTEEFHIFQSKLKDNSGPYSPTSGVEMKTTFSFEGNDFIYGHESVGLSDSPGVAAAVCGHRECTTKGSTATETSYQAQDRQ